MNLQLIKRNDNPIDAATVRHLSETLKLHPKLVELLVLRGISDEAAIHRFLVPDVANFHDPFLMKGMAEAKARLEQAIDANEKIVVYGDYDADGICASAILTLYLSSRGLDVYTHIPNRIGEGYGLNIDSIEHIIESVCPDLILTCDCGISGHEEVEYALDLGVDMIVTDHHELAEKLPECTVINPKQTDCNYPINYLCGAGVALKLVQAMGGTDAMQEYLDLAAIATVADLVPLYDENRLIVQLGLKRINGGFNLGLRHLIAGLSLDGEITSGDIAYKLAPRINAAGRMGDAYRAFVLLTTSDPAQADEIIESINNDNAKRKEACDALYNEAVADLSYEDMVHDRAIILSHPSWEKGITGIVAARLTNDFRRPSFILVNAGDSYKGTCRSIDGINVYEILTAAADLLIEYGGHSQAAGFSIREENIAAFKNRVNTYLAKFPDALFLPQMQYDLDIALDEIDMELVESLERLEPTGNSFTKPLFLTRAGNVKVTLCKNANHTQITTESGLQIFAFNFYKQNHFLLSEGDKELILELQRNMYNGRASVKSILRAVRPQSLYINDRTAAANYVKNLNVRVPTDKIRVSTYRETQFADLLGGAYGTLVVAFDKAGYDKAVRLSGDSLLLRDFLYAQTKNNYSRIIVAPEFDENLLLFGYDRIIFIDRPISDGLLAYLNKHTKAEIYIPEEDSRKRFVQAIDVSRETFGRCYELIKRNATLSASNIYSYYKKLRVSETVSEAQFVFCVIVFMELKLIGIARGDFRLIVNPFFNTELSDSPSYRLVSSLRQDGENV